MNPPEVPKQKEKQGFFRAIKKKKKKSQPVRMSHSFIYSLNFSFSTVKKGIKCSKEIVMLQPGDLFCLCIFLNYYYFTCIRVAQLLCLCMSVCQSLNLNYVCCSIRQRNTVSLYGLNRQTTFTLFVFSAKRKVKWAYHPKKEAVHLFHCPVNARQSPTETLSAVQCLQQYFPIIAIWRPLQTRAACVWQNLPLLCSDHKY